MGFVQKAINRDEPYGKVYAGSGEQSALDKECAFYQNGLYFDTKGNLLADHPHNAERIKMLEALTATPRLTQQEGKPNGNPDVIRQLGTMSDEDIYHAAVSLVGFLTDQGKSCDYEPVETDRDANVDFIVKYTA